ncbi:flagellar protein FlgN [Methylobacterium radiodurans]|uniref:Flagellar protein FlgN n=1 Tax=Methylobacterium radiodurans TaxID=2202828 RepID=A0A2U8VV78_9HYPH|nr:flagellar protein FlgN [Methylobacterium radiodurans]AWN37627.1 flagellar protein FlgN [Methylobacterium radiodurans]
MLIAALKRLEETVEAETEALLARQSLDHAELNRAKSRSLLELTRLTRDLDAASLDAATAIHLARLRDKLVRNQEVVGLHLRAVEEIGETLAAAALSQESDGTYTARLGSGLGA